MTNLHARRHLMDFPEPGFIRTMHWTRDEDREKDLVLSGCFWKWSHR